MASSAARARRRPISHIRGGGAAATAGRGTSPVRIPFDRVRAEPESHAGTVGAQQLAVGHLDPFMEQPLEPRPLLGISHVCEDRKSVVSGKRVYERVDLGGCR